MAKSYATHAPPAADGAAARLGICQSPFVNVFSLCGVVLRPKRGDPPPATATGGGATAAPAASTQAATAAVAAAQGTKKQQQQQQQQQQQTPARTKDAAAAMAAAAAPAPLCGHELGGRVGPATDADLNRRVLRISGAVPAANYIKLPRDGALGLTGRFCYVELKLEPPALFAVHLDLATVPAPTPAPVPVPTTAPAAAGTTHARASSSSSGSNAVSGLRVTIGNIVKDAAAASKRNPGTLQLAMPPAAEGGPKWTLLCVDLAAAARAAGAVARGGVCEFASLRSVTLCGNLRARGVWTSGLRFGLQSLPRDMVLSHALPAGAAEAVWLPREPSDVREAPAIVLPNRRVAVKAVADKVPNGGGCGGDARERARAASVAAPPPSNQAHALPASAAADANSSSSSSATATTSSLAPQPPPARAGPAPDMALERVLAYSGEQPRVLLWAGLTGELVFAAGCLITAQLPPVSAAAAAASARHKRSPPAFGAHGGDDTLAAESAVRDATGKQATALSPAAAAGCQRHFAGHTARVSCLALGGEGRLLASGQEGRMPAVRLWDFTSGDCLAVLCAHASSLAALDVSPDGAALLAVGRDDAAARQAIAVWDVSAAADRAPQAPRPMVPNLLARAATDYDVCAAAFVPFEPDAFMTAGRGSVRVWRLRGGGGGGSNGSCSYSNAAGVDRSLRGMSVQRPHSGCELPGTAPPNAASGLNIYTTIAFEPALPSGAVQPRFAFVATAAGTVFCVDTPQRTFVAAYAAHAGPIHSIAAGPGIAVTAGDDGLVRAWPLDFRAYLLEAAHAAAATAAALSPCGLRCAVGTEDGGLGVLDLAGRRYVSALRSHTGRVDAVAVAAPAAAADGSSSSDGVPPLQLEFATAAADGTARIWHVTGGISGGRGATATAAVPLVAAAAAAAPACTRVRQRYELSIAGGDGGATAAAYHPVRRGELAVGYGSGALRAFDAPSGALCADVRATGAGGPVTGLLFGADGARLFVCGGRGGVAVLNAARGYTPLRVLQGCWGNSTSPVTMGSTPAAPPIMPAAAVALSPDGSTVVITAPPRAPRMRIALTSSAVSNGVGDDDCGGGGGGSGATGAPEPGACLIAFDTDTLAPSLVIETRAAGFSRLAFSPCGRSLWGLTAAGNALLRFDPATGRLLQRIDGPHRHYCSAFALACGGAVMVTGGGDGLVKAWQLGDCGEQPQPQQQQQQQQQQDEFLVEERHPPNKAFVGHPGAVRDVAIVEDVACDCGGGGGRRHQLVIAAGEGGAVSLWRLAAPARPSPPPLQPAAAPLLSSVTATADGAGSAGAAAVTVNTAAAAAPAARSEPLGADATKRAPATIAAPHPNASWHSDGPFDDDEWPPAIAAAAPAAADTNLCALPRSSADRGPKPAAATAGALADGPIDGASTLVGLGAGDAARCALWDRARARLVYAANGGGDVAVLRLAGGGGGANGGGSAAAPRVLCRHEGGVGALALSPDGTLLATAGSGGGGGGGSSGNGTAADVFLWDAATLALVRVLRQHGAGVARLAFSPDGAMLASAGAGPLAALVLWDTAGGGGGGVASVSAVPVALGRAQGDVAGIAWLPAASRPTLLTVGTDGLLSWTLAEACLEQRKLVLPGVPRNGAGCTAVCSVDAAVGAAPNRSSGGSPLAAFVADSFGGAVWRVELGAGGPLAHAQRVASLPAGERPVALQWSPAARSLAVGTDRGRVVRFTEAAAAVDNGSGGAGCSCGAGWSITGCIGLGSCVAALALDPANVAEGVAATRAATAWYMHLPTGGDGTASPERAPLLRGHAGDVLQLAAPPAAAGGGTSSGNNGSGGEQSGGYAAAGGGDVVASVATDGALRVWRLDGSQVPVAESPPARGGGGACTSAAFACAAAGQPTPMLAAGYADGTICVLDVAPGREPAGATAAAVAWSARPHASPVVALCWHPGGAPLLLSAGRDGAIAALHADTGAVVSAHTGFAPSPAALLHSLAVAPDGARAAVAWLDRFAVFATPWAADGTALQGSSGSGSGRNGGDGPLVEHCARGRFAAPPPPSAASGAARAAVAFLPAAEGRVVAFASPFVVPLTEAMEGGSGGVSGGGVLLYDVAAAAPLCVLALPCAPASLACGGPRPLLAVGLADGAVLLADARRCGSGGGCGGVAILRGGHSRAVVAAAFSADGESLVTAAGDAMRVWRADRLLARLEGQS